jgi:hypothetical protein
MEGGRLAKSYVYGSGAHEPVKMSAHTAGAVEELFYLLSGRGDVTGLFSPAAGAAARYRYDAFGWPLIEPVQGSMPPTSGAAIGTGLLAGAQLWDGTAAQYMLGGRCFDARTGQFMTSTWGGYVGFFRPTPVKPLHPDWTGLEIIAGIMLVGPGLVLLFEPPIGTLLGGALIALGLSLIVDAGQGSPIINEIGEWLQGLFGIGGNKPAGPGKSSGGSGGGGSNVVNPGTSSGSGGTGGGPPGQPEGRDFPEHKGSGGGSSGGGSGGPSGGGARGGTEGPKAPSQPSWGEPGGGMTPPPSPTPTPKKPEQPKQEQPKPEDKKPVPPGTPVAMPNPVDGTGEGIDRDWWRGQPYANVLEIAARMRAGLEIDERHGTPHLRLSDAINTYSILTVVAPPPISVDERGETVSIHLAGAQSRSTATGTTTSDGWGDRPRSMAEALAAPRIRVGSVAARY